MITILLFLYVLYHILAALRTWLAECLLMLHIRNDTLLTVSTLLLNIRLLIITMNFFLVILRLYFLIFLIINYCFVLANTVILDILLWLTPTNILIRLLMCRLLDHLVIVSCVIWPIRLPDDLVLV